LGKRTQGNKVEDQLAKKEPIKQTKDLKRQATSRKVLASINKWTKRKHFEYWQFTPGQKNVMGFLKRTLCQTNLKTNQEPVTASNKTMNM
jgi:hypothetical protein